MEIIKKSLININLDSVIIFVILLIPIFLITGAFLPDLSITFCAFLFFFYLKKDKFIFDKKKKYFTIFFSIFYFFAIVSSLHSQDIESIFKSLAIIRFYLFTLLFWHILEKYKLKVLKKLFKICVISTVILIADSFLQIITGTNILGYSMQVNTRVSSLFGDELILGSYLFRILCLLIALNFFFLFNIKKIIFFSIFIILTLIIIFLSGERAALFLSILYLFLIPLIKSKNSKKFILTFYSVLILSIIIIFNSDNEPKTRIINSTFNQFNFNLGINENLKIEVGKIDPNKKVYIFSEEHETLYRTAIKIFEDNKLFGVGIKNFREACKDVKYFISNFSCNTHPHNYYIQFLAETGIIIFLFFFFVYISLTVFLIYILIKKLLKRNHEFNNLNLSLILYYFVFLFPFLPSGSFFNNWLSITFFYPMAILMWSFKNNDLKDI